MTSYRCMRHGTNVRASQPAHLQGNGKGGATLPVAEDSPHFITAFHGIFITVIVGCCPS